MENEKYKNVKEEFDQAIKADPKNADAHLKYIKSLRGMGEEEKALEACRTIKGFEYAAETFVKLAETQAALFYEDEEENNHNADAAARRYATAAYLQPDNANYHLMEGKMKVAYNNNTWAFDALEKAIELDPQNPEAYVLIADVCSQEFSNVPQEEMQKKAEEYYLKAQELSLDDEIISLKLATNLGWQKKHEEAIKVLEKAIDKMGKNELVFCFKLGSQYQAMENYEEAISWYERAVGNYSEVMTMDWFGESAEKSKVGEWFWKMDRDADEGWGDFMVMGRSSYTKRAHHNKGECYYAKGDFETAQEVWTEIIELEKKGPFPAEDSYLSIIRMGEHLMTVGKGKEAIGLFEAALEQQERAFRPSANHAEVLFQLGKLDEAKEILENAFSDTADDKYACLTKMVKLYTEFGLEKPARKAAKKVGRELCTKLLWKADAAMLEENFEEAIKILLEAKKQEIMIQHFSMMTFKNFAKLWLLG